MNPHEIIYNEIKEGGYAVYKEIRDRYVYFKRKNNNEAEPKGYGYNKYKLAEKLGRSTSYVNTHLNKIEAAGLIESHRRIEKIKGEVVEYWTYKPVYDLEYEPHCEEFANKIIAEKAAIRAQEVEKLRIKALTTKYGKWEGYVYIILDEYDRIKIGLSDKPQRRFSQIKSGSGLEFKNTYVSPKLFNCQTIEGASHKLFDEYRIGGEWFKGLAFEEAIKGVEGIIKQHKEMLI